MKIVHHLDDATIVALASGSLGEAHATVAAAHLAYCPQCRAAMRGAETIGSAIMALEPAAAVSDICRSATLASLDAITVQQKPQSVAVDSGLPKSISSILGNRPLSDLPWKKKAPGVAMCDLPMSPGARGSLKLLSIGSGRAMPEHGHGGEEITLVLQGSYKDHMGRFAAGDVADLDEDIEHRPVVDSEEACICLVATEAPTRFKPLWAKLMQPFVGI